MALENGRFSSVSEAMEYLMPSGILGSQKVGDGYPDPSAEWVFWCNNPDENSVTRCSIEERIRRVLITLRRRCSVFDTVQFWAVKRIAGRKCILTTSHQPFGIKGLRKGYYSYRKECMRRNINVGPEADVVQLGPPGRAFRNASVEFSPNISFYNVHEFPLRDHAILCGLDSVLSLPVFEFNSNNIVGVLEFLCPSYFYDDWVYDDLAISLKEVGLRVNYSGSSESMEKEKYSEDVVEEVHKMFKGVAKTHPLALGLAFAPCLKEYCLNCSGIGCLDKKIAVYKDPHMHDLYESYVESNWISGRAYASGKSCFCRDIRNFSILEYPLAHHARLAGLTFSFATIVQSIQDENLNVLALEFLLLPGNYKIENIRLFTGSLLTKIKELLPHYKVAEEDFLVDELVPEIYDKIDHVQVSENPLSLPVTLTCCCDSLWSKCVFDDKKAVVDFFLPVKLSYETSRKNIFLLGSSSDKEIFHDALVLWRNDVQKCDGMDERIKLVFKLVTMKPYGVDLVQFWAPRIIEGALFLTTFD